MLQGCNEDTILKANLSPGNDTLNVFLIDSATILSDSFQDDTLVTSLIVSGLPIYHALGTVASDPFSGRISSASIFQVVPPTTAFSFPTQPDSAVLVLPYSGYSWGDTTPSVQQTFTVYELLDSLSRDSLYYSYSIKNFGNNIGSASVTMKQLSDSVSVNGKTYAPQLRIRLAQTYLDRIKASATNGNPVFASYSAYLSSFRGFYIKQTAGDERTIHYFRFDGSGDDSRANVLFYYTDTGGVKSSSFYFNPSYVSHFNYVNRDYTGTLAGAFFTTNALTDSVILIQNEPGGSARLKFPFIKFLPKAPIVKAELIITQVKGLAGDDPITYSPPERIFPVGVDKDGSNYTVLDRFPTNSVEPLNFINGTRHDVVINGLTYSQYTINLPREVQRAVSEQRDTLVLRLNGASGYPGAYRLLAGGSSFSKPEFRVKLRVYYSRL